VPKLRRVDGRRLVRALERRGWHVERIKGSQRHRELGGVTVSVPVHGRTLVPLGTLASILRDARIDAAEFNEVV
jgi:predicted RNA binding protein YcfA (HicA-like mRNA interferase family)